MPNAAMPNVFMATSLDTPDRPYRVGKDPGFNVHSPFKQPVGARLARAGLSVAYGMEVDTTGPRPGRVSRHGDMVILQLEQIGSMSGVKVHSKVGFEVLVASTWKSVTLAAHTKDTVAIGPVPREATQLRYLWYSNPCGESCFGCAVYIEAKPLAPLSGELPFLPLPPFVMDLP